MSHELPLEQRLSKLESAVADIQKKLSGTANQRSWLDKIAGSFKDEPDFEKVLAYGREFRHSDRPSEDERT